ncbi:hypothetical protein [Marimonas arenosa]|uniref:Uncharacterized protein n=1 Tax=Marimonas arenosa TaxID=1795305 RepID=A0AAE3WF57_9RHOB|nr:hypothetical protein [Marimonas arenosa]MDQ2091388.1 hypothetical protein [Marimonas arenosa]
MSGGPQPDGGQRPSTGSRAGPVFLERANYRKRRLIDAIRLIPVLGALLWAIPLMWARGDTPSSAALLYLFGVWVVLVGGAALLTRALGGADWEDDNGGAPGEGG